MFVCTWYQCVYQCVSKQINNYVQQRNTLNTIRKKVMMNKILFSLKYYVLIDFDELFTSSIIDSGISTDFTLLLLVFLHRCLCLKRLKIIFTFFGFTPLLDVLQLIIIWSSSWCSRLLLEATWEEAALLEEELDNLACCFSVVLYVEVRFDFVLVIKLDIRPPYPFWKIIKYCFCLNI